MKGMKKVLSTKMLVVIIVGLLLIASAVGYTVAKYVTTDNSVYTARVAKWDVSVEKASTSLELFAYADANVDIDGNGTERVIAPGTSGSFEYELTNSSEVTASYMVDYTADEAGVFLQWSIDGINWTNDLSDVVNTEIAMGATVTERVYWKWAFESDTIAEGQNDVSDTNLGLAGTATPSLTIDVTFVQEN